MKNFLLLLFSISFLISDTYSWEDGEGTILGSYYAIESYENIESTDSVDPYDGARMLKVVNGASDDTERVYLAWIKDISDGDQITASYYAYDINAEGEYPKQRIWAHWTDNTDIDSYEGSASGPDDYSSGPGWSKLEHTWSTADGWEEGHALCIEARFYSSDSEENLIDLIEVTTTSQTATIHLPGPVTELTADAGEDQTVDGGTTVILDGSGSANPNGEIVDWYWEQTSGIAVTLDDEEAMTTTFTSPNESTVLNFDLTISDADGNESIDSVIISVIVSAGNLSIADIQGQTNSSPYEGQVVSTSGLVTADPQYGFFIQDAEGIWNGIWIFDYDNNDVSRGDLVEVSGLVEEYNGLTEINILDGGSMEITSSDNMLFNSVVTNTLDESHESVLVTVSGICNSEPDPDYGEWLLGDITIQNEMYDFNPIIGQAYTITGPVDCYNTQYKVLPRDANDVQEGLNSIDIIQEFSILRAYPNPFNPEISINFSVIESQYIQVSVYDLMGQKIDVLYNGLSQANKLNHLIWDASNFSSGDYIIQLKADNFNKTHKITLIK